MSREPNDIRESSLYNEDLAPGPQSRRDWGVYNYASLWVGMSEGPARIRIPSRSQRSRSGSGHRGLPQGLESGTQNICVDRDGRIHLEKSPDAAAPWSRSSPAVPAPRPESESRRLSSYFADTTLVAMANLAETLQAKGELVAASMLQKRVLGTHERLLGDKHPQTTDAALKLVLTLGGRRRYERDYYV